MAKTSKERKLEGEGFAKRVLEVEVLIDKYNNSTINLHRVKKAIFRKLHAIKKKHGVELSLTSSEGSLSLVSLDKEDSDEANARVH